MKKGLITGFMLAAVLAGCGGNGNDDDDIIQAPPPPPPPAQTQTSDGPGPEVLPAQFRQATGNAGRGMDVFRFETFNNQAFWTDAMRLPQGIAASRLTPLQALQIGLSVNVAALNSATVTAVNNAIAQVRAGTPPEQTALGDPAVTLSLINQNAVIGLVAFAPDGTRKPLANSGMLNIAGGDKVGVSCAACHAITDGSVFPATPSLNTTGTIGRQVDGPTPHRLDVGRIFAAAQNSLAYLPLLQVRFDALQGLTIGRGNFPGLQTGNAAVPTEAQADLYLTGSDSGTGERFYPIGQFDDTGDGIGNPLHITSTFRLDLAAPFGIDGGNDKLDDFNNNVYVTGLDPTSLLTPSGREFLRVQAGAAGEELANDYEAVLRATGVIPAGRATLDVIPFVRARTGFPPGSAPAPVGRRVDEAALLDLNAYFISLPSPRRPVDVDMAAAERGRMIFRTLGASGGGGCTECHNVDPNKFVQPIVVAMRTIYPGYNPTVIATRAPPLAPVQNSQGPSPFFDDREVVIEGSRNGTQRGSAYLLLLDLPQKFALLHDDSVRGANFREAANRLMDPNRGNTAAHPFFISDQTRRNEVIEFLRSLQTDR